MKAAEKKQLGLPLTPAEAAYLELAEKLALAAGISALDAAAQFIGSHGAGIDWLQFLYVVIGAFALTFASGFFAYVKTNVDPTLGLSLQALLEAVVALLNKQQPVTIHVHHDVEGVKVESEDTLIVPAVSKDLSK